MNLNLIKKAARIVIITAFALVVWAPLTWPAEGRIVSSKHNLSVSGRGQTKALKETQICIFCHSVKGKGKSKRNPFLWNKSLTQVQYTPYESSTLIANVGQPTGASRICLSCHDGTIALGRLASHQEEIQFAGGLRFMPDKLKTQLGTDLSDDHPISFPYTEDLATLKGELALPQTLPPQLRLDADGSLQCTTCHDPHDDTFGKFLVMSNQNSALCVSCHRLIQWEESAHSTVQLTTSASLAAPRGEEPMEPQNGCGVCHRPHSAERSLRLLRGKFEEDNCLKCHNDTSADSNIEASLKKTYKHPVQNFSGIHDPTEDFSQGDVAIHVECEDCHNAHKAQKKSALQLPATLGPNLGVSGITVGGQLTETAKELSEICFKCHGDNNVLSVYPISRDIAQLNTRLEFYPGNPSYHPVGMQGVNDQVPSLIPPLTPESTIECTDCHNGDDIEGPKGPHGSNYEHLLAKNYFTDDGTVENPLSYALCYSCHSRENLLGDQSFKHRLHVVEQNASCALCHDPHGINRLQGTMDNNSHLINFDITVVKPESTGNLYFKDLGSFTGQCFLTCHGKEHVGEQYP